MAFKTIEIKGVSDWQVAIAVNDFLGWDGMSGIRVVEDGYGKGDIVQVIAPEDWQRHIITGQDFPRAFSVIRDGSSYSISYVENKRLAIENITPQLIQELINQRSPLFIVKQRIQKMLEGGLKWPRFPNPFNH